MKYKVIVSEKAKEMLKKHVAFISNVSKESAIKQKDLIIKSIKSLKDGAEIYPFFESEFIPKNKYHKLV